MNDEERKAQDLKEIIEEQAYMLDRYKHVFALDYLSDDEPVDTDFVRSNNAGVNL